MVTRSDVYGWNLPVGGNTASGLGQGYSLTSNLSENFDWAAWVAQNQKGVDCELTVQLIDGYVVAVLTNNGLTSTTTVYVGDDADRMYVALSGEKCKLTKLNVEVFESEGAAISVPENSEETETKEEETKTSEEAQTENESKDNGTATDSKSENATGKADEVEADVDGLEDQAKKVWPIILAIAGGVILLGGAGAGAVFGRKKALGKKNTDK